MQPKPSSILDELTEAEDVARLERARADIKAGRVVPHEEVEAWLDTWSDPDGPPAPRHWFK